MPKTVEEITKALCVETPAHEVHFYPQKIVGVDRGSPKALCVPYITRQFVEDRLDSVMGPFGWQSDARAEAGVLLFGLGLKDPDSDLWIWKWDTGAGSSNDPANESVTGGIKRAGRLWGIGRDIARLESKWRECRVKKRNNKYVFDQWAEPPSVAELRQYTAWLRKNSTDDDFDEEGEDKNQSSTQTKRDSRVMETEDGMKIGTDAVTQFFHVARKLKSEGAITQEQVDAILEDNRDAEGVVDYVAAKADLDMKVPF